MMAPFVLALGCGCYQESDERRARGEAVECEDHGRTEIVRVGQVVERIEQATAAPGELR